MTKLIVFDLNFEGFNKSARKIGSCRGGELSIAGGGGNPHVAVYVPGTKGAFFKHF